MSREAVGSRCSWGSEICRALEPQTLSLSSEYSLQESSIHRWVRKAFRPTWIPSPTGPHPSSLLPLLSVFLPLQVPWLCLRAQGVASGCHWNSGVPDPKTPIQGPCLLKAISTMGTLPAQPTAPRSLVDVVPPYRARCGVAGQPECVERASAPWAASQVVAESGKGHDQDGGHVLRQLDFGFQASGGSLIRRLEVPRRSCCPRCTLLRSRMASRTCSLHWRRCSLTYCPFSAWRASSGCHSALRSLVSLQSWMSSACMTPLLSTVHWVGLGSGSCHCSTCMARMTPSLLAHGGKRPMCGHDFILTASVQILSGNINMIITKAFPSLSWLPLISVLRGTPCPMSQGGGRTLWKDVGHPLS